ncbi:Multidrug resistance protein MdtG [Mycobacterium marinum]|nr:Multidrug resistance protein MdtG [Mycobacterium marinum]RFZ09039.1 Multidrug resistance protein MdtG [Mycobacterium marinum]RFZ41695.1 Multidrug resistance protein MdtG [Mycobacterium marinum]RFZ51997.1 Multidrug resistance protein MdtG [Mycobacterium marinum]CDM77824.1 conserved integral membrane transport protein [Mycobacterium marinum E11]
MPGASGRKPASSTESSDAASSDAMAAYDALPRRVVHALDLVNFSLADVRDGLGPYLSVYLLVTNNWDQASIGFVMAVGGIAAIVAQTPMGAFVDRTKAKRALVITGALAVTASALAMPLFPELRSISLLQVLTGIASSVFAPALAAITLGIVGPQLFARRIGRNESFNHAGNATAAAITGGLAFFFGPVVVFWVLASMAAMSVVATLRIPHDAIDHDLARGMDHAPGEPHAQPSGFGVLLHNRTLMIFAAAVVAFHFANAAMLPLVGQVLALHNRDEGTALMSWCIVAAQVVMVPVAYVTGSRADAWGRKPIFLVAFAVLTARGFLYTLSDNSYWLVGVQLLDGIGAGIFGALFPLIVQDLTHGTGHFNISLGAITTAVGVGAALSNFASGWVVVTAGYNVAFMSLGAIAGAGFILYLLAMPETASARLAGR